MKTVIFFFNVEVNLATSFCLPQHLFATTRVSLCMATCSLGNREALYPRQGVKHLRKDNRLF